MTVRAIDERPGQERPLGGDVAVIGMSCLFPGAPDLATYWGNILGKVDAITDAPPEAWDTSLFYDPRASTNDRVYCKRGGYIDAIADFDPMEFGIMPAAVDGGEPDQWLALKLAYAALADAGYPGALAEHARTEVILGKGTYVNRGNMTVGYHGLIIEQVLEVLRKLRPELPEAEIQAVKAELKGSLPPFSADTAPALIGNIIAGRIANRLDLMGPSFTVDAACASALVAVDIALTNLASGKSDLVLVGGANVTTPLPTLILFCQLGALSRREEIRPFDKDADGTLLAEGIGMVVLKRLTDAERDGDRIYALIKGVGTASDGRAMHVMAPRVEGEELALHRAYQAAGVAPATVGLIEAHGTATPVGDAAEIEALRRVLGPREGGLPRCALGSVKSMIGHTMPAAGIAGLIKTVLALYHRVLPPTIHCDEPDPRLGLERTPLYVNTEPRPWIHPTGSPRRAGVSSFGFGGINGHVVLEEHPGNEGPGNARLSRCDSEVLILGAASRAALIERAERLRAYAGGGACGALEDIAYTLSREVAGSPLRLAVVATDPQDLAGKLAHAVRRLADPTCHQIKDNKGIYYFAEPLARTGKLAVMFPGEGAQYPGMLADLCLHFPEVRNCFDLADRAFVDHPRGYRPSDFIFPRALSPAAERAEMARRLWQIEGAVEGVLIANRAMWALLSALGLKPDAMVGHSTGDYSAMFASGIVTLSDEASYIATIGAWNSSHESRGKGLPVPQAALVAVAADADTVRAVMAEAGGELYLAMENCPHQGVVVGEQAAVERVVAVLRARGLIYEQLPFDRPYHTPLFGTYAEAEGQEILSLLPIGMPNTPIYSCTTAEPYPADADAIRRLFVAHWMEPVRFLQTIERMYADGVRIFVEAGPRGNLSAFVADILRGRPHLVMPANLANRSGITQLNHLVGILTAQGLDLDLGHLYARRATRVLDWQGAAVEPPQPARARARRLALGMPLLQVAPRAPAQAHTPAAPPPAGGDSGPPARPAAAVAAPVDGPVSRGPANAPAPGSHPATASSRVRIMQGYQEGMETFLGVQQEVMQAYLARVRGGAGVRPAAPAGDAIPAPDRTAFPLLGEIRAHTPGRSLFACRRLDRGEDIFLEDHALGGPVALTDAGLRGIMVVPLTLGMEVLAEAAAALMPGQRVVGMREVLASEWIRVEDEPVTLHIQAERDPDQGGLVRVEVRLTGNAPVLQGTVVLDERYPGPPPAADFRLTDERPSRLAGVDLYGERLMFHGPCFQGVTGIARTGTDGLVGELTVLPWDRLFRSVPEPRLVTDPLTLDAAGQMVGFWAREHLERGFVVFPYRLGALHFYGPNRAPGERVSCRLKVDLLGDARTRADLELIGPDGVPWMWLHDWEDRRFDPPPRFHRFWTRPGACLLAEPWEGLPRPLAGRGLEGFRLGPLFEPASAFWNDLLASLILTREERTAYASLPPGPAARHDWLAARAAAKDALRAFVHRRYGLELLPGDIGLRAAPGGALVPVGAWLARLPAVPALGVGQAGGWTRALAGDLAAEARLGIALAASGLDTAPGQQDLDPEERRQLPAGSAAAWAARVLLARLAVGRALGDERPDALGALRLVHLAAETGVMGLRLAGGPLAQAHPALAGAVLTIHTLHDDAGLCAVTLCERKAP